MTEMTARQEAHDAIRYGLNRRDLSPAAQLFYDRLVANVSESLEDYADLVIRESWFKHPGQVDPGLAEWAEYYLRRGLELLDAIPRDHPMPFRRACLRLRVPVLARIGHGDAG
jgi:hypothetical protein